MQLQPMFALAMTCLEDAVKALLLLASRAPLLFHFTSTKEIVVVCSLCLVGLDLCNCLGT